MTAVPDGQPDNSAAQDMGWACASCGWATTESAQFVWDDGPPVVALICPQCHTVGNFVDYYPKGTAMHEILESVSAAVHAAWMDTKRAYGVTSRCSEMGEELMVPYEQLSEPAKELDRATVRGVLDALDAAGYAVTPR